MKQKGLIGIIVLIFIVLVFFLAFSYLFLAKPYKVVGDKVVSPFKPGEQLLSESISYLFRKPVVGDRVIFTPQDVNIDFVGIITKVENKENVTSYTIVSVENGRPWVISVDKIKRKIYFPFIDDKETEKIALSLQSTPVPSSAPDETANWKTYTNKQYTFRYPDSWDSDISDQQYFESGIILHTKEISFSDFRHFQKGGVIYKFLLFDVLPKIDFIDLNAVIAEYGKPQKEESIISESDLILDGQQARERVIRGNNVAEVFLAFQYPGSKGYSWLTMLAALDSFESNKNTFSQILSTFKFTN